MGATQNLLDFILKENPEFERRRLEGYSGLRNPTPPASTGIGTNDPLGGKEALKITRQAKRQAGQEAKSRALGESVREQVKQKIAPKSDEIPL